MDSKKLYIVSLVHQDRTNTENNDIFILGGFLEKKKAEKFIKKILGEIGDPGQDSILSANIDELNLTEIFEHGSQVFEFPDSDDDEIYEEFESDAE
jgi:hypothetical protein